MGKTNQLILIDESGDTGFKFDRGSSRFFVIVAIIFDDLLESEKVNLAISNLKKDILGRNSIEFKFNHLRCRQRQHFFQAISKFNFSVNALIVDKIKVKNYESKNNKDSFYRHYIRILFEENKHIILNASVKLDGNETKGFQAKLKNYLNSGLNHSKKFVSKLRIIDSKTDNLIQLADMVAGCIRRKYEIDDLVSREDFEVLSARIKNKIVLN